jgi:hypothetical protein
MYSNPFFILAVGVMIALIILAAAYGKRLEHSQPGESGSDESVRSRMDELEKRFADLETRLKNLETVMIRNEKNRRFADLD